MKYQLTSASKLQNGSAVLEFKQAAGEIDLKLPVKITIEGFLKDADFAEDLQLKGFYEIEFVRRDIYKIDGKLFVDVLDYQKHFKIEVDFQQRKDPFDYSPLDEPDDILDAEIIE